MIFTMLCFLLFGCACNFICVLADAGPIVTLSDGTTLSGAASSKEVTAFKGVRYATPPVGNLRWAPTEPYVNSDTSVTVDATEYGSICTQPKYGGGSEDCLHLNVFVNSDSLQNTSTNVPVGLYIHGGSYHDGSSNMYDATDIVNYLGGSAIIVTVASIVPSITD